MDEKRKRRRRRRRSRMKKKKKRRNETYVEREDIGEEGRMCRDSERSV